jgi:hypothetical protein
MARGFYIVTLGVGLWRVWPLQTEPGSPRFHSLTHPGERGAAGADASRGV